ncbi:response regulator [Niallia endozanthoxylica]|uniref:Response regulator n=1 Tax=Niallia endozanthoxylica TaxID=2036016 RepID=A0A5J5I4Q2_9BACI|nr:response regulator [Niallia endozanthoxylica]KAA9031223.1 response regulator [Niallia endozanthoxylica]
MISVVLIEDDLMVQEVNRQFVNRVEGFQVIGTANNGIQGLEMIRELRPELALVDVYMPDQNGLETLYKIRKEAHKVDIIAITAASDIETVRLFIQNGAFDYIVKPFKFERIKKSLENYRDFRLQFNEKEHISQKELDEIFLKAGEIELEKAEDYGILPKGLNQLTLEKIIEYLSHCKEPLSAETVAEGVGLARVTVRRYLDFLEKCGKVELDIYYGGIGRPINKYLLKVE